MRDASVKSDQASIVSSKLIPVRVSPLRSDLPMYVPLRSFVRAPFRRSATIACAVACSLAPTFASCSNLQRSRGRLRQISPSCIRLRLVSANACRPRFRAAELTILVSRSSIVETMVFRTGAESSRANLPANASSTCVFWDSSFSPRKERKDVTPANLLPGLSSASIVRARSKRSSVRISRVFFCSRNQFPTDKKPPTTVTKAMMRPLAPTSVLSRSSRR